MNNYEYIIAGLPSLSKDWKFTEGDFSSFLEDIKAGCSAGDRELVGWLEKGFDDDSLTADFYRDAMSCRNRFIREYFTFDLNVRNAKTRWLNEALGRPADKDVISVGTGDDGGTEFRGTWGDLVIPGEFEEAQKLDSILRGSDILAREKGLDDLMWEKIDSLTTFDYFDINVILGFLCKLHIVSRWAMLDEQTGREMFRKLVDEVRGTFRGFGAGKETENNNNKNIRI